MLKLWSKLILILELLLFISCLRQSWTASRDNSFKTGRNQPGKNTKTAQSDHASTKLKKSLVFYTEISGGRFIAVYDETISDKDLFFLQNYAAENCDWTFAPSNASTRKIPWNSQILKPNAKISKLSGLLSQMINRHIYPENQKSLAIRNIKTNVLMRGDFSLVEQDMDEANRTVSALLFLTRTWNKNDYGEVLFYGDEDEIIKPIHPRFGRLILFDGSIPRVQRAPAMLTQGGLLTLEMTFDVLEESKDKSKEQELRESMAAPFVGQETSSSRLRTATITDVSKYVTREYKTLDGLKLVVFDDVMSKKDTDALRSYMVSQTVFQYTTDFSDSSDNVQWVTGWAAPEFVNSRYWDLLRPLVNHVTGTDSYYPYDVTLNLIRSYDNTQNHRDCPEEDCPTCHDYTLLVYLNRDWSGDMHGETVFFDSNGELLAAVSPRYGRVALFRGKIWHSARPPTSTFQDARLTFAVKFKPDKKTALMYMETE